MCIRDRYHEHNNRQIKYKVGDLVMYKTHPMSKAVDRTTSKLSYRWCGQYQIHKFITPVTVSLYEPNTENYVRRSYLSQIKKCVSCQNTEERLRERYKTENTI